MAILETNGKTIAIGVEWSVEENKSAVRKACAKKKGALQLVIPHGDAFVLGLCTEKRSGPVYSGAAIVANAFPNAVLCEKLDSKDVSGADQFWICAISDKVPLPGKDKLLTETEARSEISELMAFHPNSVLLGTYSGSQARFHEVLNKSNIKDIQDAQLKKPKSPVVPIVVCIGLIMLLIAGLVVFKKIRTLMTAEASRGAMVADAIKSKEQIEREIRQARAEFDKNIERAKKDLTHRTPIFGQFNDWMTVFSKLPASRGGWSPSELSCTPAACSVIWQKGMGAISLGALDIPRGDPTGDSAVKQQWPLKAIPTEAVLETAAANEERLRRTLLSISDVFKWGVRVDSLTPVEVIPPEKLRASVRPVIIGKQGKWMVIFGDAAALVKVRDFIEKMRKYPVNLTSMKFSGLPASINVQIEGDYVVFQDISGK